MAQIGLEETSAPSTRRLAVRLSLLALVVLVAAFFRSHDLGGDCFDCDELYAVRIQGTSITSLASVVGRTAFHDLHPPLSYIAFLYWTALVGTSEAAVRALPLLLGVLSVVFLYLLGRRLHGPLAGLLAAGLLALNPLHIAYSQEARPYAILAFLAIALHLSYLRSMQVGKQSDLRCYSALALLALFTHYFAVPVLASHAVLSVRAALTADKPSRSFAIATLMALLLAIVPFLSWLPILAFQTAQTHAGPSPSYLAAGDFHNVLTCLSEVAGAGGSVIGHGALASMLGAAAFGLWVNRANRLPSACAGSERLLPVWCASAAVALGLLAALGLYLVAPTRILPRAAQVLAGYGYGQEEIARELDVLRSMLLCFPLSVAGAGALVLTWPWMFRSLERIAGFACLFRRPLSACEVTALLVAVPILSVLIIGLLGIPFVSSRNLLILAPALSLAAGSGLAAMLERRWGFLPAGTVALALAIGALQYDPVAAPLGMHGDRLGMHSGPWDAVGDELRREEYHGTGVAVAQSAATDPALFYLGDLRPLRLSSVDGARQGGLDSRFRFIHVEGDPTSERLLQSLEAQAGKATVLFRRDPLVLLEVTTERKVSPGTAPDSLGVGPRQ